MAHTSPLHTTQNLASFFLVSHGASVARRQYCFFLIFSPACSIFNKTRPHGEPSQQYFCSISLSICVAYSDKWQESLCVCLEEQNQFCWCRKTAEGGRSQTCTLPSVLPVGILSPGAGMGVTWTGSARQCADN